MDRPKLNFLIDAVMFLCLMAMAGLGFLMKYILPPGREVWQRYGRNVDLTWLGWDRHDWGIIHLYLGFTLLALLVLHIILHWHLIPGLLARLLPAPGKRGLVALVFVLAALLLIYFPFLITPEMSDRGGGRGRGRGLHGSELKSPGPGVAATVPAPGCASCPELSCQEAAHSP